MGRVGSHKCLYLCLKVKLNAVALTISAARTGPRTRRRRSACWECAYETPRGAVRTSWVGAPGPRAVASPRSPLPAPRAVASPQTPRTRTPTSAPRPHADPARNPAEPAQGHAAYLLPPPRARRQKGRATSPGSTTTSGAGRGLGECFRVPARPRVCAEPGRAPRWRTSVSGGSGRGRTLGPRAASGWPGLGGTEVPAGRGVATPGGRRPCVGEGGARC